MTRVAIIGSGFGGLAAAIELTRRGIEDLVILEKADDVGGVWRENTYPGAACDVPSPLYSFSYAPNPRWPRRFSEQPDILAYLREVADRFDVRRHIRFGTEVTGAEYDDASRTWRIGTSGGEVAADVLVPAVGQLSRPSYPAIEGRDTFAGPSFHSAEWDHHVDLTGRRVAVVGTGASAIQFVPEIQPVVGELTVFQRTPPYLMPRPDTGFSELHHRVFTRVPAIQLAERAAWWSALEMMTVSYHYARPLAALLRARSKLHLRGQVPDPGLREKLWPSYDLGCKRILFSDDYFPALARPNVEVVTDRIREITEKGVVTQDGVVHEADVIVYGTGFTATDFLAPMRIRGCGGRDLREEWTDGARAYLGITVPHFPNLFLMYGPNTNLGTGSIVFMLECQARYLGQAVAHLGRHGPLTVREDVEESWDDGLQARLVDGVWSRCTSWYRKASGRVTTNWPGTVTEYRRRTARFDPADYERG
jgi:cation diffusion facilitator CzcD-associated flavoprotein CzcO